MKDSLAAGIATTRRFEIDKERTIDFMGEDMRIYSTPSLLRDIEQTCREFLLDHLDEGEDTVGVRVELDNIEATLLGMTIEINAAETAVEVDRWANRSRRDDRRRDDSRTERSWAHGSSSDGSWVDRS